MTTILIIAFLLAIVIALGSGMVFMIKDDGDSHRTVRALTWRIGLSLTLIAVLALGYYMGWIQPHGIRP